MVIVVLIGAFPIPPMNVLGAEYEEKQSTSVSAPKGYVPISDEALVTRALNDEDERDAKVLLIQDSLPWSSRANDQVLDELNIAYDKATTTDFISTVDLSQYEVVIFANDQAFGSYENYKEFKEYLEKFAELGGVIVFGACDNGWAEGILNENLPGDVRKSNKYTYNNYIADSNHPIVTGELSDGQSLQNEDLYSNYCSHIYFLEESLPAGSRIILRNSDNDMPTLIEYPLGNGRVIASGLTWEHNYNKNDSLNLFAKKAMDDMFLYALRVSDSSVKDLDRLNEYRMDLNAHQIIVSDSENSPIENAKVTINESNDVTDQNGIVKVKNFGKATVTVTADGYQTRKFIYNIKENKARIFFLSKEENPKLPYVTMVEDTDHEYDFLSQKVYYTEGDDNSVEIEMDAEWYGKIPAEYVLYQTDENGKDVTKIVSMDGKIKLKPGKDLKPGYDVKVRLYASDGTASRAVHIGIVVEEASIGNKDGVLAGDLENITGFSLFEDTSATLDDNDATNILPSTWSFKVEQLPVQVNKTYDPKDGSSTFKGTIGLVQYEDILRDGKNGEWESLKQQIEEAKDLYSSREDLLKKYHDKMDASDFTSQFKFKFEALGYFEIKCNAFGDIIKTSGGLIVQGNGSYNLGKTFSLGPVPVYFELTLSAKLGLSGGLKYTVVDDTGSLGLDGTINVTIPDIIIGGGLGVYGVAQVGVEGHGGIEMQMAPEWKGTIKASASVKVKVLFLGEYKWQLGNEWKKQLWPPEVAAKSMIMQSAEEAEISLASIDYLTQTTSWDGDGNYLQEWILPDTMPEIVDVNGQKIIFFQSNVGQEDTSLIELMYSVYEDGYWSEPQAVYEDKTNDLFYKVVENGDSLYIVWQNVVSEIEAEDAEEVINELAQKSEIFVAKWDAGSQNFIDIKNLSNNTTLDMLPRIAVQGDNIIVAWVNNNENDVLGNSSSTYTIQTVEYSSGKWNLNEPVSVDGYISDIAVGYYDNGYEIAYICDGLLYTLSGGVISSTDVNCNGVTFVDGSVLWIENGMLYSYSKKSGKIAITDENVAIGGNYRFLTSNDKTAIVWTVNEEDGIKVYTSLKIDDRWSDAVEIYSLTGYVMSYFDVELNSDGSWELIADVVSKEDEQKSSLLYQRIEPIRDIKLDYVYLNEKDREGNTQPIKISAINLGDSPVEKINIVISSGGSICYQDTMSCYIQPGKEWDTTVNLDVSGVTGPTDLEVYVGMDDEADSTNNIQNVMVGLADLSIELEYYSNNEDVVVGAKVLNNSSIPVDATISVIEDDESGIVIDMKKLGKLDPKEEILYLYSINTESIDFKELSSKNYVFTVSTSPKDYNAVNNSEIAIIYNDNYINNDKEEILLGDLDQNGIVNAADALTVLKIAADLKKPTSAEKTAADVNKDGRVNAADALSILKYAAGLSTEFV